MEKIAIVFVIFFSVTVFDECKGFPGGAPTGQCEQMTPNHGPLPQTGASPYEIKVTKKYYVPGENVRVSIESSSDNIKGYLIQARRVGENSAIGTFAAVPANGTYVNCSNSKGAITHSTRLAVKTINFDWVPPANFSGNVSFYATVVKNVSTFWVKLQSQELYKLECPSGDPKCDNSGAQLNHSILILLLVGVLVFWQNMV